MEKLLFAWGFTLLLLLDAGFNWGILLGKRQGESSSAWSDRRRSGYGPITRALLLCFVGVFFLALASFTVQAFVGGGMAALRDPSGWLRGRSTRTAPQPPVGSPSAAAAAVPAPPRAPQPPAPAEPDVRGPEPERPSQPTASAEPRELRFWVYENAEGVTSMVDALDKIPPAFRARARELK